MIRGNVQLDSACQKNKAIEVMFAGDWDTGKRIKTPVLLNSLLLPLHDRTFSKILECIEIGLLILECSKYIQRSSLKVNVGDIVGYCLVDSEIIDQPLIKYSASTESVTL